MIALLADVHLGNHKRHSGPIIAGINRRCRHILDALEAAVERARERRCEGLVVLGDLFDTTNPQQQIVTEVQRIFRDASMPVYVLLGNHDQVSEQDGDHALGPLAQVATIIDQPVLLSLSGVGLYCVPFQPGPATEWLPRVLEETSFPLAEPTALLLHLGLTADDTPAFMRGHDDSVSTGLVAQLCKSYGFNACFAGNWHAHKVLRKRPLIVQVGCLVPTGWDNEGLTGYGNLLIWDPNG